MDKQEITKLLLANRGAYLKNTLYRTGHIQDAEDIVSEMQIIVLSNCSTATRDSRPDAEARYIWNTLRSLITQYHKERRERAEVSLTDEWDALCESDNNAWITADMLHEARYRLKTTQLGVTASKVLALRLEGVAQKDIAKQIDRTLSAIKKSLSASVKALRACPMKALPEPSDFEQTFYFCAKVIRYRHPTSTGSGFARMRLSKTK